MEFCCLLCFIFSRAVLGFVDLIVGLGYAVNAELSLLMFCVVCCFYLRQKIVFALLGL
jgi:hypothetical protein